MFKFQFVLFFLILIISQKNYAQTNYFTGYVIEDESNNLLDNINVEIYKNKAIIFNTKTDSSGVFKIPIDYYRNADYIEFKSLTHFNKKIRLTSFTTELSFETFKVKAKRVLLKEVIIKLEKGYRDTIRIDLSNQNFKRSFMIDDFFHTNNFYKDQNGKLYYNGKLITELKVNGKDFFDKNNVDLYKLLPALILNGAEVIETNIDSVTHTITQTPSLKVNLQLKDNYLKGKFGNLGSGYGSTSRYIYDLGIFSYNQKQQFSLLHNSNNLNINNIYLTEPQLNFSPIGNIAKNHLSKFDYKNTSLKNFEFDFSSYLKFNTTNRFFESYRNDANLKQQSTTYNQANTKSFGIDNMQALLTYKIDTMRSLKSKHMIAYINNKNLDSNAYEFTFDGYETWSKLLKDRRSSELSVSNNLVYQYLSPHKKGRNYFVNFESNHTNYIINENNNLFNYKEFTLTHSLNTNNQKGYNNDLSFSSTFIEPINKNSYSRSILSFKKQDIQANINTDNYTSIGTVNHIFQYGSFYQTHFNNLFIDASYSGILTYRDKHFNDTFSKDVLYNSEIAANVNWNITKSKTLQFSFTQQPKFPDIYQLTGIGNSFDVISQLRGNINLKPEIKQSFDVSFNIKASSLTYSLTANADHYQAKFGFRINTDSEFTQQTAIDNIGNTSVKQLKLDITKNFANGEFIKHWSSINFSEVPVIINNVYASTKGFVSNNSISMQKTVFNNKLSFQPIISFVYNEFKYNNTASHLANFTYSDKISLTLKGYEFNLFPFVNYNLGQNNTSTWALNADLKKSFFKSYLLVWVKAYDLFNSFKYYNNIFSSSYTQSIKYANLNRYILLGANLKFNNMK